MRRSFRVDGANGPSDRRASYTPSVPIASRLRRQLGSKVNSCRPGNGREVCRQEARAADEPAIDLGHSEDLAGVRWLHRAAVEDVHRLAADAEAGNQLFAKRFVHGRDIIAGWGEA